ncbi:MAG: hypothetical protein V8T87_05325 [Victivallales bacterium]
MQTRILAVPACDWTIQGTDARRTAEVRAILEKAGLHALMRHLLDALALGYSGAAIIWGEGGADISAFRKVDPSNWQFDLSGNPALMTVSGKIRSLAEYIPTSSSCTRTSSSRESVHAGSPVRWSGSTSSSIMR